ncbi:helix-turn-helix domain-containing protein [Treponema sp.]|uniref:AraC family transcriptional regulator n=1 Tax=Treponema sp. TaxID=166 RepID=UPI00388EDE45
MLYYHLRRVDSTRSPVCGLAMLNPGWIHMRRSLETETVLLIGKKGSAKIEDNGNSFEIAENKMLLLPASHLHRGVEPCSRAVSYWWFHFYQCVELDDELRIFLPKQIDEAEASLLASEKKSSVRKTDIILPQSMELLNPERIGNLCGEALHSFSEPDFSSMAYNIAVQKILLELEKQFFKGVRETSEKTAVSTLVKKTLELLESELSNPNASVKYFADRLCVNPDYLGRCFKEVMKIPVGKYLNLRRVELACSRLRESNHRVEEIAFECGFGSRRQFFEEFKRKTGKTPSAYRAESAYIGINVL